MIQRIQSLYLLLAFIAVGLLFFFPIADLIVNKEFHFIFRYRGLYEVKDGTEILSIQSIPLAALLTVNLLLSLITIFLYKKRLLQLRISVINIVLLLGSIGMMFFYVVVAFSDFEAKAYPSIFAFMPLIAAILTWMAFRAIKKDEQLVRSVDRIR